MAVDQRFKDGICKDASNACGKAINDSYDLYARENISNLRKNLSTGIAYTQQDKDTMDAFIDAKRQKYQDYKDQIDACTEDAQLYEIVFDYS